MKTKLCLLFVMAVLVMSQLAYGQAPTHQVPQAATVELAGTTFIILVPVSGPPVQYQYIGGQGITHHSATYRHYGQRSYGHGYGGYSYGSRYGSGYRTFHHTSRYFRHPNGRVYLVPRNGR